MNPEPLRRLRAQVVARVALGGGALCALTWVLIGRPAALGLGLGLGVGALAFHLHGAEAQALGRLSPADAERRARWASLARTGLRAATLAVAHLRPELSFSGAAAGLLALPALLAVGLLPRGANRP